MIDHEALKNLSPEEKGVALLRQGYNCCQSVVYTLTEDPLMLQAASGFGGGMGNTQGPCGALVGAVMAAGIKTEGTGKGRIANQIRENFRERSGAVICRELKGIGTGKVLCSCEDCVRNGVKAFKDILGE